MKTTTFLHLPILTGALFLTLAGSLRTVQAYTPTSSATSQSPVESVTQVYSANTIEPRTAHLTFSAPAGYVFTSVPLAQFGAVDASGNFIAGANPSDRNQQCSVRNVTNEVSPEVVGRSSVDIAFSAARFGDVCLYRVKTLRVTATYAPINAALVSSSSLQVPAELQLTASPNPSTNGQFTVHVAAAKTGPTQVILVDMQGNIVAELFNGQMNGGEERDLAVNRPNMKKGLYLVRVQNGSKASSMRVELQK
jgi:hypothetical protein